MKKLIVACLALAFAATACPAEPGVPVNYAVCPTAGAGQIQVAVVTEGVPNPAHEVVCVVVTAGSNGFDALAARSARIGTAAPRFNGEFLCAIDAAPAAPKCGTDPAGPLGFSYWNYSLGGATWTAAEVGAADRVLTQGSVDGWNYGTWDFVTTFPANPTKASSFAALTQP